MDTQRGLTRLSTVLFCAAVLAGCSFRGNPLMSTGNVANLQAAAPQPGTGFTQNLANDYSGFSTSQLDEYDYTNADYFARKGLAAAHGQAVPPEDISRWNIPAEKRQELAGARARLVSALDGGGRERAAPLAARAQERYDCWVEEQEENWQSAEIASCRSDFLDAMTKLEAAMQPAAAPAPAPAAAVRQYNVYFNFDRSNLTPDAKSIVADVAKAATGNSRIELVGKADRAGPANYNLRLSDRRANAVVQALVADGVARDRITTRGVGETEPPVPTPDGVREPRNRVVEITIH